MHGNCIANSTSQAIYCSLFAKARLVWKRNCIVDKTDDYSNTDSSVYTSTWSDILCCELTSTSQTDSNLLQSNIVGITTANRSADWLYCGS